MKPSAKVPMGGRMIGRWCKRIAQAIIGYPPPLLGQLPPFPEWGIRLYFEWLYQSCVLASMMATGQDGNGIFFFNIEILLWCVITVIRTMVFAQNKSVKCHFILPRVCYQIGNMRLTWRHYINLTSGLVLFVFFRFNWQVVWWSHVDRQLRFTERPRLFANMLAKPYGASRCWPKGARGTAAPQNRAFGQQPKPQLTQERVEVVRQVCTGPFGPVSGQSTCISLNK